jgi:hypothetical protein
LSRLIRARFTVSAASATRSACRNGSPSGSTPRIVSAYPN